jgi:hypothetical protein
MSQRATKASRERGRNSKTQGEEKRAKQDGVLQVRGTGRVRRRQQSQKHQKEGQEKRLLELPIPALVSFQNDFSLQEEAT